MLQTERSSLEALQWRASLANSGDRDSLLANPDAIALPVSTSQTVTCWWRGSPLPERGPGHVKQTEEV